ncbi:MAG: phosphotransferase [Oscillochloris sp.]|nr:phosphotransferase [Oscillochloris sp.]
MIADTAKAILAHAMPGAHLREIAALGKRTLLLTLEGERRVVLRLEAATDVWAGDPLAAEAAALATLRPEIDLPLPELLAYDDGTGMGIPYLICSHLEGMPLTDVISEINEDERYALGRELGSLMARIHSHAASGYGPLGTPKGGDTVDYLRTRIEQGIVAALAASEIDQPDGNAIRTWLAANLAGSGQSACLVHGDLRLERVLLRRRDRGWRIAGLVGWGFAQGWRPGWDHATLMEYFAGPAYFGLRVGYGNAYDATTERRYDQLRELALLPFRLALFLEIGQAAMAVRLVRQE